MKCALLESKRLWLKPLDRSFSSQVYVDWMNDEETIRYLESGGNYTKEKLDEYLLSVEQSPMLFWAILIKDGLKHIGNIKIDPVNQKNQVGEYGILLGDKLEWGKGYAREASNLVIKYCFSEEINLRKITLGVVEDNRPAVALYEKMGFELEGIYKRHTYHNGKWCNVLRMAKFNPNLENEQ